MENQKDSDQRRKEREWDKFKKRKRRPNMTQDQLEKKRAYDRDRYNRQNMQSSLQNDSVPSDQHTWVALQAGWRELASLSGPARTPQKATIIILI